MPTHGPSTRQRNECVTTTYIVLDKNCNPLQKKTIKCQTGILYCNNFSIQNFTFVTNTRRQPHKSIPEKHMHCTNGIHNPHPPCHEADVNRQMTLAQLDPMPLLLNHTLATCPSGNTKQPKCRLVFHEFVERCEGTHKFVVFS